MFGSESESAAFGGPGAPSSGAAPASAPVLAPTAGWDDDDYYLHRAAVAEMPATGDVVGEPEEWTAADEALLAAVVAADPAAAGPEAASRAAARPREQVLADGEHAPVTAGLVAELDRLDPASLPAAGRLALAVAWSRVENYAAARKTLAVAGVAGPAPADPDDPRAFAWAEVGAALRLGDGASTRLVGAARTLVERLPATVAAMTSGDVSLPKAMRLADRAATLTTEQCTWLEERAVRADVERGPRHRVARGRHVGAAGEGSR
jgi:hypothetical protein